MKIKLVTEILRYVETETSKSETISMSVILSGTHAAVAKGYSDALVRRRSRVQFPSAAPDLLNKKLTSAKPYGEI